MILNFPNLSISKLASTSNVSRKLVYHILHDDLHLKPYKNHNWHKLKANDYEKRVDFAQWFLKLPAQTKFFFFYVAIKLIFISIYP